MRMIMGGLVMMAGISTAGAQDMEALQVAMNLGNVIGSEEFCGLTYKQAAIEDFIAKSVDEGDMSFNSTLEMAVGSQRIQNKEMTASQKTAHCAQIRRVAKKHGFTE